MTIKDLKNMMIVETRNQERYLVVDDKLLALNGFNHLKDYNNNLVIEDDDERDFDIMAVYTTKEWGAGLNSILYCHSLDLVWKREEDLLTSNEKKYLEAMIKPVIHPILGIQKQSVCLVIQLANGDEIVSADFESMLFKFNGLEKNKLYTLEDLGIED